ncbi:hypothetical protein CVIRNUC_011034 [Coccomyxa viridis]|uniref:TIP41-like protein n=1 Tax=Coccomyxa viridis TaxID=1274662 RepID=A0AAV1INI4_9CHLO|nr:hypothetical protein CVIRNUC_011034 [Coccomyxa viridis]
MAHRRGTFDEAAIKTAGASILKGGFGIELKGWRIESCKAPISSDAELDIVKERLSGAKNLPEQLFGNSFLRLSHVESGLMLSFTALGALQAWHADDRPPVRVDAADAWMRSRERDVQASGALSLDYDWTYTTQYSGSLQQDSLPGVSSAGSDWEWVPTTEQLDKSMLMARDPILFYDEIPLFESELDDNGVSQLLVKVRVMPGCWFVLLRFWLRVDRVLVRLYETRLLGSFQQASEQPMVCREVRRSEGTFAQLHSAGAPPDGPAYQDADSTALALQAAAPIGVTHFSTEHLQRIAGRS